MIVIHLARPGRRPERLTGRAGLSVSTDASPLFRKNGAAEIVTLAFAAAQDALILYQGPRQHDGKHRGG